MLSSEVDDSWSFKDATRTETSYLTHGYHRYPAKYIPQLAARVVLQRGQRILYRDRHQVLGLQPELAGAYAALVEIELPHHDVGIAQQELALEPVAEAGLGDAAEARALIEKPAARSTGRWPAHSFTDSGNSAAGPRAASAC